ALPADGSDPVDNVAAIEVELAAYSAALTERPIWLALSKVDVIDAERRAELLERLRAGYPGRPLFAISAVTGEGIEPLVRALLEAVRTHRQALREDEALAAAEADLAARIGEDVLKSALVRRPRRRSDDDDDDDDVEVHYVP